MSPARRSPSRGAAAQDLLLEIGTEELPAAYLPGLIDQLARDAGARLRAAHITFGAVESYGTPRRLILRVAQLGAVQVTPPEEIRGPSKQAAYGADGTPTPALLGFLKSRGGSLAQSRLVKTDKGEYVYVTKPEARVPTATILPELVRGLIAGLKAPKAMRWDTSGASFARPVRWLVALLGGAVVPVTFGRLTAGRATVTGGPLRPRAVPTKNPAHYFTALKAQRILWDQDARRQMILKLLADAARAAGGIVTQETLGHGLLDEVVQLIEHPAALSGAFDQKYLSLPQDVLLASMAKHQRVFAVHSKAGKLLPAFIAILDGAPGQSQRVRQFAEHVLNARLADSLLFWDDDRTVSLSKMRTDGITFHEKLGSMQDKTTRLAALAKALADDWQLSADERTHLERACRLAKSDLASRMVREFPTLQGIMGKHYALAAGEHPDVAAALEEQYLPQGDTQPKTRLGSALSILDKFDTLAGYFGLGIEPTGNEDPFGLRRCGQGIVEITWAGQRPLSVERLMTIHGGAAPRVKSYLGDRLYTFAWPGSVAPSQEIIAAALASPWDDLLDLMQRMQALAQLAGRPQLQQAAKIVERTHKIVKAASGTRGEVDPAQFQVPLEHELWKQYSSNKDRILDLIQRRAYTDATAAYSEAFYDVLHRFFDEVYINVPEEPVKQNRLALMNTINALYTDRIADLSKLSIPEHDR